MPDTELPDLSQMTDDEFADYFDSHTKPVYEAVKDFTELEWVIDGLVPAGALIMFAGQAKRARKTLLLIAIAMMVARGGDAAVDVLTRKTKHGHVFLINLEDGYARLVRRLVHSGVEDTARDPCQLAWTVDGLAAMTEMLKRAPEHLRPKLVIIDPLIELARLHGIDNENDSIQMSRLIAKYRKLAQDTGCGILIAHHMGWSAERMRGSSATEGACDGWWELIARPNSEKRTLRWTLRDGGDGEVDLAIRYEDDCRVIVEVLSEFRDQHTTLSKKEREQTERMAEAEKMVCTMLRESIDPLSTNAISKAIKGRKQMVGQIVKDLQEDGIIERQKRGWVWVDDDRTPDPVPGG